MSLFPRGPYKVCVNTELSDPKCDIVFNLYHYCEFYSNKFVQPSYIASWVRDWEAQAKLLSGEEGPVLEEHKYKGSLMVEAWFQAGLIDKIPGHNPMNGYIIKSEIREKFKKEREKEQKC